MEFFRYWARVEVDEAGRDVESDGITGATGWSNLSLEDARRHAAERARQFALWLHDEPDRLTRWYAYARPVREPILDELHHDGERTAVLTRNAVGVIVLNAAGMFIADIDDPTPSLGQSLRGVWNRLRGRMVPTPAERLRSRVEQIVAQHPWLGVRLYRTAAGHRAIVVNRPIPPDSQESKLLLNAFGSDPLYVRLCQHQKCYRARLTPKPWRTGLTAPNVRFPFRKGEEAKLKRWLVEYESRTAGWATCELVAEFGDTTVAAEVHPVLTLHDARACAPGKPLA